MSGRWWRAYDEAVDDPKLQRMPGEMFKAWFNVVCLASRHDGWLPSVEDIAFSLRKPEKSIQLILDDLLQRGLLDDYDGRFTPHNWNGRQHKSDVSTDRVKRFRKRSVKRDETVSETPPEQIQNRTEQKDAPSAGANAPRDVRADLFGRGLQLLASMTGKTPDSCRSLVGRWLKAVKDEAIHVLAAIDDAERNKVADPVAWITATLNSRNGGSYVQTDRSLGAVARAAAERAAAFAGANGLRDDDGRPPLRAIPKRESA